MGQEHLIEALVRMKDSFNSYTLDRVALSGATEAFLDTSYFEEKKEAVLQTRAQTIQEMEKRGFSVLPSAANFIFATHEEKDAEQLYEQLRKRKVLVRYFHDPRIDQYLRITIGTDEEMEQFFRHLDELI